ncbi:MAG: hypothetical protein UY18_C0039G0001, partial [Microgenomates group bacterium GW2011_GWF2_47_9]
MKNLLLYLTIISSIGLPIISYSRYSRLRNTNDNTSSTASSGVLGTSTGSEQIYFTVNVPAVFNEDLKAPNVVYSLRAGEGITLSGDAQSPTISNTGILELVAGTGISVEDNKITSTITQGLTSLTAGTNISIDGNKITNTYTAPAVDFTESGWTISGTTVGLTTTTNSVVVDGLTFGNATITNGKSILPDTDLGSDLGSPTYRFNNIYAANLEIESGITSSGQALVTYNPADTTFADEGA